MTLAQTGIWISALGTIAMMSLLVKENPYYRFFEHLFIGVSAGHAIVLGVKSLQDMAFSPIAQGHYASIIPIILGVFLYTRYSKGIGWLSRIPLAILMGTGAGLGIKGSIQAQFLDQVTATFLNMNSLNNILFILGVISTIWYFFFTYRQPRSVSWLGTLGRWTMMVTFGASFGNAAMGRLSLLIGRFQFLWKDWLHLIK